jgi:hypothetical protein
MGKTRRELEKDQRNQTCPDGFCTSPLPSSCPPCPPRRLEERRNPVKMESRAPNAGSVENQPHRGGGRRGGGGAADAAMGISDEKSSKSIQLVPGAATAAQIESMGARRGGHG